MKSLQIICIIFFLILKFDTINSAELKIVAKIDNNILTNLDVENERKYLIMLNPNLQELNQREIYNLSRNSLIRETIKNEEVKKYFKLENYSKLESDLLIERMNNQGFKNKDKYLIFLKQNGLNIEIIKEKILTDKLWKSLIFEKFKNKIKIDENKIRKNITTISNNQQKKFEYDLSEILFDTKTNYNELTDFIEKYGFETAANKYSISDTSRNGGKIGWIKIDNLNNKLKDQISSLNEGEISLPIEIPNGKLLIKVNKIKEIKNKISINEEIKKQINFERNKQLNNFSINYYKKLKQNKNIYEY